jgi:peptidoglycan/LPS O-acetylase OafA/YrhL
LWLGKVSFSLYMTQWILYRVFLWSCDAWVSAQGPIVGAFVLTLLMICFLAVAWAVYELVERPSHRLARRLAASAIAEHPSGRIPVTAG